MNGSFARLLTTMMFIAGITSSDIDKVIDDEVQNNAERSKEKMKYEFVLTEQMENDRKNCGEDSRCLECSCHMGEDDCVFNHLYITAELPKEQLLEKLEAVEIIKSLMSGCTPDSKYYKVGKMAINVLSAIEDIKQEIEKQHANTSGYGNNDFLYGKHQAYGNCLDIINKHIDKEE